MDGRLLDRKKLLDCRVARRTTLIGSLKKVFTSSPQMHSMSFKLSTPVSSNLFASLCTSYAAWCTDSVIKSMSINYSFPNEPQSMPRQTFWLQKTNLDTLAAYDNQSCGEEKMNAFMSKEQTTNFAFIQTRQTKLGAAFCDSHSSVLSVLQHVGRSPFPSCYYLLDIDSCLFDINHHQVRCSNVAHTMRLLAELLYLGLSNEVTTFIHSNTQNPPRCENSKTAFFNWAYVFLHHSLA